MRRVLVLGGTGWLGRRIAQRAVDEGAEVVCLARGESGPPVAGARFIRADRRGHDAYQQVRGDWDEVIELATEPELVSTALHALADGASHWTLVSSVSVYRQNDQPGADESADLMEPTNPDDPADYAAAKVAAEQVTSARLGERLLIARPGLIAGPGDPSDRFGYWMSRLSRSGPALVPALADRFVQIIDVDDLADWIVRAAREDRTGVVNAVGDIHIMQDFFDEARTATGYAGELVGLDDDVLLAHDVRHSAGPRSLPLWLPGSDAAFAQRSGSAFRSAGGHVRPLRETLARVLADEVARGIDRPRRSGLTAPEEHEILRAAG